MPHAYPLPGVWLTTEEKPLVANVTHETRTLAAQIQEAAKQLSLSTATGDSLDRFATMMGIQRQRFEPAVGSVVPLPFEESDAQLRARLMAVMDMGRHIANGNIAMATQDEEDDALDAAALLGGTDAVVAVVQAGEASVDKGAAAIARARERELAPWWGVDPNVPRGQIYTLTAPAQANAAFGSGSALASACSTLFGLDASAGPVKLK